MEGVLFTQVGLGGRLGGLFCYTQRHKFPPICHSGLDPESSVFLDSRIRGNDVPCSY